MQNREHTKKNTTETDTHTHTLSRHKVVSSRDSWVGDKSNKI